MMGSVSFKSFKKLALWNITPESKSFDCPVCGKNFTNPRNFMDHALTHEKERHYLCPKCGASFKQRGSLAVHIVLHSDDRPWVCSECPERFKHSNTLHQHIRNMHTEFEWKECPECKNFFKRDDAYENHLKIHEKDFEWLECDVCDKKYSSQSGLKHHLKTHDEVPCPECGRKVSATRVWSHMKAHLPGYLECPDCGDGVMDLARHRETHYSTFECTWEGCEATFHNPSCLREHELDEHLKVEFRCKDCGRRYASKYNLDHHKCRANARTPAQPGAEESEAEESEAAENVQCEKCERKVLPKDFKSHMMVHTHNYRECPHCGRGLKSKKTYGAHLLTHKRPTGYMCRVEGCNKAFSNHSTRSGHERRTHADVMLKCDDCAKLFLTEADLANHECHPK